MGKKRGNNEGSVFKRERDGQWVGKVTVGYRDGKQVRREFTGKTQGVGIEVISGFMGHSSIVVTADYYRHPMPGESKKAAEGMSNSPLFKTPVEEKVADNAKA